MIDCANCKNYNPVNSEKLLIKPIYSIGDEFWRMLENKPSVLIISRIRAEVTAENINIYYSFRRKGSNLTYLSDVEESAIENKYFKTKQELLESL